MQKLQNRQMYHNAMLTIYVLPQLELLKGSMLPNISVQFECLVDLELLCICACVLGAKPDPQTVFQVNVQNLNSTCQAVYASPTPNPPNCTYFADNMTPIVELQVTS